MDWRCFVRLSDGRALVSCRDAVLILDTEGKEVGRLEGAFAHPEGIAVNSKGSVYVTDRHHHCIHVFDSQLNPLRGIVTDFQEPDRFDEPVGIAISPVDDSIWVADSGNNRVLHLDTKGRFISVLGNGYGTAPGQFFCPCGVALYNHPINGELVVVSEWGGGRVQVFKAGQVFSIFGGVPHAHHVVVDSGFLLVNTMYLIKKFSLDGESVGEWTAEAMCVDAPQRKKRARGG